MSLASPLPKGRPEQTTCTFKFQLILEDVIAKFSKFFKYQYLGVGTRKLKSASENSRFSDQHQAITELKITSLYYLPPYSCKGYLNILIICSASAISVPERRSTTMMSEVSTPFVKVLGWVYAFKMWMPSLGTGTKLASFQINVPRNSWALPPVLIMISSLRICQKRLCPTREFTPVKRMRRRSRLVFLAFFSQLAGGWRSAFYALLSLSLAGVEPGKVFFLEPQISIQRLDIFIVLIITYQLI